MDDLEKFVDFLFEDQQGYVYSPSATRNEKGEVVNWTSEFFAWPDEKTTLLDHIKVNSPSQDVYLSPVIYSKKDSKTESFKSSKVIWVEFDGKEQINFKDIPKPDAIVQTSSSTHLHCYWKTGVITNPESLSDVNRRLTFHFGADSSGWDSVQLLRPPSTSNIKRGGVPVVLAHLNENFYERPLFDFDSAPEVEHEVVEIVEAQILDASKLLPQLPILRSLRNKIEKEVVVEPHRSQFLYKIAHELAEVGCNHTQIASIIYYVDERIGKFKERSDRLRRISELASLALHDTKVEEQISLYTPLDILQHTEDLEWIYERWLHEQGLLIISGAPGVGKTQFCLNLAYAFSVGAKFLASQLPQKDTLFLSLEMDIREMKQFLQKQTVEMSNLQEWVKHAKFADEPGTLLQYEELIEQSQPGVVFIDSLLELSNGEMKDGAEVIQITRWLKRIRRKYQCAIVLIHHNRKGNTGNKKPNRLEDLFGSVVINKDIDTAFCLWQEEKDDPIDLLVVKSRYSPREDLQLERTEHLTFRIRESASNSGDSGGSGKAATGFSFGFTPGSS